VRSIGRGVPPAHEAGVSLIEFVFVVAVVGMLLTLAVPAIGKMMTEMRVVNQANLFYASLTLARSEAIRRGGRVTLCKSANLQTCTTAGRWEQGWIMFHDRANFAQVDPGEVVLNVYPALPPGVTLSGNQNVARYISYTPSGATKLISGAFQAGTLTLCEANKIESAREIVISASGRPRIGRSTASSCL